MYFTNPDKHTILLVGKFPNQLGSFKLGEREGVCLFLEGV
jgi:hypothetical protein